MRDPATFWRFHDHLRAMIVNRRARHPRSMVTCEMEEVLGESTEFAVIHPEHRPSAPAGRPVRACDRACTVMRLEVRGACAVDCYAPDGHPGFRRLSIRLVARSAVAVVRRRSVLFRRSSLPSEALDEGHVICARRRTSCSIIGTSVVVEPAASLPFLALAAGALVVEINTASTPLTGAAQYSVQSSSSSALPALWEQMQEALRQS